jgi:hydrogenase nickel incorporation protein HypB
MCAVCGCSSHVDGTPHDHGHDHDHDHDHHHHDHDHAHAATDGRDERLVRLEEAVLKKNDRLAAQNRTFFKDRGLLALNFVSSPGSGKTTLLERTIAECALESDLCVIQGDQATDRDAERIRRTGARAIQINTGTGCHLDAAMVARAVRDLAPDPGSVVAIENVGNLVCPALFDLGEGARVALLSVAEGSDKPLKYPYLFRGAELVLISKVDLLPYVDFDMEDCLSGLRAVNPDVEVMQISAKSGVGVASFYAWLAQRALAAVRGSQPGTLR